MTVKEIRSLTVLSQAKFAERYGIPRRTIENWESGTTKCPKYVIELLEFRVKHDVDIEKNNHKKNTKSVDIPPNKW